MNPDRFLLIPAFSSENNVGVYQVTLDTGKFYIGSSLNLMARIQYWRTAIKGCSCVNSKVYEAVKECSSAKFEIIEFCDAEIVRIREQFHVIENFNNPNILNKNPSILAGTPGRKWSEEEKKEARNNPLKFPPKISPEFKPLCIGKTTGEWEDIMEKIRILGKNDFSVFIRSEVRKLANEYEKFPDKITRAKGSKKIYKRPYIPVECYDKLEKLAQQMKKPISTIVDQLIIIPLQNPL